MKQQSTQATDRTADQKNTVWHYRVTNIDNVVKTFLSDDELLEYVKIIYKENEEDQPYPSQIHWLPENIQQAKEYLVEYCPDLKLEEIEGKQVEGFTGGENWEDYFCPADHDQVDRTFPIFFEPDEFNDDTEKEVKENMKLLAAAPSMYRALQECLEVRKVTHHGDDPLLNKLQAIINTIQKH